MQAECEAIHMAMPTGLVDVVQMGKRIIKLVQKLYENGRMLQKTHLEMHFAGGADSEAQHFYLSISEEARLRR